MDLIPRINLSSNRFGVQDGMKEVTGAKSVELYKRDEPSELAFLLD